MDRQTDGIAVANTALAMRCTRCKKKEETTGQKYNDLTYYIGQP